MNNIEESSSELKAALNYALAVYKFCIAQLPEEVAFSGGSVRVGRFEFQSLSQRQGYEIELGWAFFVRMEAALEAHVNRLGIDGKNVPEIVSKSADLSPVEKTGYATARNLRNILHHGDGDPRLLKAKPREVKVTQGNEPHIFHRQIESFCTLFESVGNVISASAKNAA